MAEFNSVLNCPYLFQRWGRLRLVAHLSTHQCKPDDIKSSICGLGKVALTQNSWAGNAVYIMKGQSVF